MLGNKNLLDPTLINTIGHTAGALLFGVIVVFLIRIARARGAHQIKLSLMAALLAFGWNIGSLVVIATPKPDSLLIEFVTTASFSVLSMLSAVLLQVTLQGKHRWIVVGGYLISTCAAALHFTELLTHRFPLHQIALTLIVAGFGFLTISAFVLHARQSSNGWRQRSEWISLGCLLLFTTSFLHFGYEHVSSPWAAEIAWHHLGIPVALIVLLRDYRFLLLDTFVRFVVNSCVAAAYIVTLLVLNQRFRLWELITSSNFLIGISLVALCLSLILFAYVRNAVQLWVSRVAFSGTALRNAYEQYRSLHRGRGRRRTCLVPQRNRWRAT